MAFQLSNRPSDFTESTEELLRLTVPKPILLESAHDQPFGAGAECCRVPLDYLLEERIGVFEADG